MQASDMPVSWLLVPTTSICVRGTPNCSGSTNNCTDVAECWSGLKVNSFSTQMPLDMAGASTLFDRDVKKETTAARKLNCACTLKASTSQSKLYAPRSRVSLVAQEYPMESMISANPPSSFGPREYRRRHHDLQLNRVPQIHRRRRLNHQPQTWPPKTGFLSPSWERSQLWPYRRRRDRMSSCFIFPLSSASAFVLSSSAHFCSDFSSSLLLQSSEVVLCFPPLASLSSEECPRFFFHVLEALHLLCSLLPPLSTLLQRGWPHLSELCGWLVAKQARRMGAHLGHCSFGLGCQLCRELGCSSGTLCCSACPLPVSLLLPCGLPPGSAGWTRASLLTTCTHASVPIMRTSAP